MFSYSNDFVMRAINVSDLNVVLILSSMVSYEFIGEKIFRKAFWWFGDNTLNEMDNESLSVANFSSKPTAHLT